MPTLSAGVVNKGGVVNRRGVTLLELLIVMTLIALVAGVSYPSVASGIDALRLRSAGEAIVSFLNTAVDRADRRQQAVEILISPEENALTARSADLGFIRRLDVPEPVRIVLPAEPRGFLVYPGSAPPRIAVEIALPQGRRRIVTLDPLSGFPRSEAVPQ
jgi:prepilin-type N-terminal cleavage/methylation domain-containing protein